MNEHFVSIKVDREERPDLDAIYMDAVQAMTGQGGWPLSAFLTPSGEPFYAGTYFPPEPRHGMPAFRDLLRGVAEAWRDRRAEVVGQGRRVTQAIARAASAHRRHGGSSRPDAGRRGVRRPPARSFDATWGGFGGAPKFPQPMTLEFLLRRAVRGVDGALDMVTTTLDRMAGGGIYDQLGGGFARYSTDERWHVPHFEKMLYDNAQLLQLYTRAWQVTGASALPDGRDRDRRVLAPRDAAPRGGFYSSQDADSEGVEGAVLHVVVGRARGARRRTGREGVRSHAGGQLDRRPRADERAPAPGLGRGEISHRGSRPGRSRRRDRRLAAGAV